MGNLVSKFCGFCAREHAVDNFKSASTAAEKRPIEENGNITELIPILDAKITAGLSDDTTRENGIIEVFDSTFEWEYKMDHNKRGKILIFNHFEFNRSLKLGKRNATDKDGEKLLASFASLDFDVEIYEDLTLEQIKETLEKTAAEDHLDEDCLAVFILTHGELVPTIDEKTGVKRGTILTHDRESYVWAKDQKYPLQTIFKYFTNENCPSLANKPRLFFIQACQGTQSDSGFAFDGCTTESDSSKVEVTSENDTKPYTDDIVITQPGYQLFEDRILPHKDFFVVYSSMPGFYSHRNTTTGAWFVHELCNVIDHLVQSQLNLNLLELITAVIRNVSCEHESSNYLQPEIHQKRQIPCVNSMLTKLLYFKKS